jgi:hypothetical protein
MSKACTLPHETQRQVKLRVANAAACAGVITRPGSPNKVSIV